MVGAQPVGEQRLTAPAADVAGVTDFDADGLADILWSETSGRLTIWFAADPGRVLRDHAGRDRGARR